jgi:hypothetical protein
LLRHFQDGTSFGLDPPFLKPGADGLLGELGDSCGVAGLQPKWVIQTDLKPAHTLLPIGQVGVEPAQWRKRSQVTMASGATVPSRNERALWVMTTIL